MTAEEKALAALEQQAAAAMRELLEKARVPRGGIVVVGCSSSEVVGGSIGKASSLPVAGAIYKGVCAALQPAGVFLAAQCCEHLNRAIVLERAALKPWQQPVNVVPQPHAGGSFATCAYKNMKEPVAVEYLQADAGLDIGDTFIGMHIKPVAVPVRLSVKSVGEAHLTAVRRRPKSIGGERAVYNPDLK